MTPSKQRATADGFATHPRGRRRHRPRRDRRGRRRRGPRERGRPHHGGRARHAREDRVLRAPHLGRHLRAAHRRAPRRARPPADGRADNTEAQRTAFTFTVDYRHGTTTGISAADRAATVQALIDPATRPGDLARPGHIFPLRYADGGVLKRAGHTEAAVDLARMAGLYPAGVLCEIVNDDGTMARVPDLVEFCEEHDLLLISIADLIRYRRQNEKLVKRVAEARIPTEWGDFTCYVYESVLDGEQHLAFVKGAVQGEDDVLVRVHSECLTGDVFGSLRCDCGAQLDAAMQPIADEGLGVRRLPARPRGPRHRHRPQDPGLRPAGPGPRHRRRQPRARPAGRQPRVRHRRADPGRPRHHHHAAA